MSMLSYHSFTDLSAAKFDIDIISVLDKKFMTHTSKITPATQPRRQGGAHGGRAPAKIVGAPAKNLPVMFKSNTFLRYRFTL